MEEFENKRKQTKILIYTAIILLFIIIGLTIIFYNIYVSRNPGGIPPHRRIIK